MSLIQDALKKVQHERKKIQDLNISEDHQKNGISEQKTPFLSKKKIYIGLGLILLFISIVSITTTFLLKKPVTINKKNNLKHNTAFKTKKKVPQFIAQKDTAKEILNTEKNKQYGLIKRAKIIKAAKDRSIDKTISNPIYRKATPKKTIRANINIPVLKQKIELVSRNSKNKSNKQKVKRTSKFEEFSSKGELFFQQKKYIEAVSYFKKALKIKKSKDLYLNIYKCYKKTNNLVLLKAYSIDALQHYKDDVFFNKILGILLFREKAYLKALSYFDLILQKMNRNIEILTYKALCLFHLKKLEDSLAIFKIILKLNNKKIEAYYYIGLIYDNFKNYSKALEYYRVFERLFEQQNGINKKFRHRDWIRKRISLLARSMRIK